MSRIPLPQSLVYRIMLAARIRSGEDLTIYNTQIDLTTDDMPLGIKPYSEKVWLYNN